MVNTNEPAENLNQRSLALWEAELHNREKKIKEHGERRENYMKDGKTAFVRSCECDKTKEVSELLADVIKMRDDEKSAIEKWKTALQELTSKIAKLDERESRARSIEDGLLQREKQLLEREVEVSRREAAVAVRESKHQTPLDNNDNVVPKHVDVPLIRCPSPPPQQRSSRPSPCASPNASPKYAEGKTGYDPMSVESFIENISDSEGSDSPRGGIFTAEGVVGIDRWRELYHVAEDTDSDSDNSEHPELGRKETWKRRFSNVSEGSQFTEDEFDQFYDESEGLDMKEALLQYMLRHGNIDLPPGMDPALLFELLATY
eukprot:TRINITY_DN33727_c0_g1_i1.p1 TRINITY_DN33727_c0_g1~~TRINITY_DN33727_c0_g1_i1.p1  ORF type:complete len:318 (+),score=79.97 TRINITY_DN33727_c0_g1_i1:48-1001(+)